MIVILNPSDPKNKGAIEKMSLKEIEYLRKNKIDHKIVTTTKSKIHDYVVMPQAKVIHLLLIFIGVFFLWRALSNYKFRRLLRRNAVEEIFVNSSWSFLTLNKKTTNEFKFTYIQHQGIGSILMEDIPVIGRISAKILRVKHRMRMFNKYSVFTDVDAYIFIKEIGIDKNKIIVNPNFVEESGQTIKPFTDRKKNFLFFGRLTYDKNIPLCLEFAEKNGTIDFFGSGQKRFINSIKNSDSKYHGYSSESPLKMNMNYKFNVLIATKRFEGYPLSTLEALSVGTVPIVNKRNNLFPQHQILLDEGIAIPYDEFDIRNDYSENSTKAMKFVKNLNFENYCNKLFNLYL